MRPRLQAMQLMIVATFLLGVSAQLGTGRSLPHLGTGRSLSTWNHRPAIQAAAIQAAATASDMWAACAAVLVPSTTGGLPQR